MTPTMTVDPGAAGIETADGFDSTFDDISSSSAATEEVPEVDADEAEPELEATEPEPEAEIEESDTEEETEPESQTDPDQPTEQEADGKGFRISKNRLSNLQTQAKFADEVRQIAPTVEHVKALAESASDFRHMRSDVAGGDPGDINEFAGFWAREAASAFPTVVSSMTAQLKQVNPESYTKLREQFVSETVESLYQRAAETGDPDDLYKAQTLEYSRTGKYRTSDQLPKADPARAEREKFEAEKRSFETRIQKQHDTYWQRTDNRISEDRDAQVNGLIDKALEPTKGRFDEDEIDAFKLSIRHSVENAIKNDFEWNRNMSLDYRDIERTVRNALKNDTPVNVGPQVKAYIDAYIAKAQGLVRQASVKLVNKGTATKVTQNRDLHKKVASSQKRGTAGAGAPPKRTASVAPKTLDEAIDELLK